MLAVGLLPLAIGIVFVQRGADHYADATTRRALAGEARTQATNLESYFARSRSVILLAARDAAIRKLVNTPGGRRAQLRSTQDLDAVNGALGFLERLYPKAIGEACLIDGRGRELGRVVHGQRARQSDLSLEEAKTPFFAPTVALRPGQVFQAAPYVSPDTDEWVISNSTPVPGVDVRGAMLHFEVTVESFRRQAAVNARRFSVAVVDARTGRVAFDSRRPQRRGEPLGSADALRFGSLRGYSGGPRLVELPGAPASVRPLAAQTGNANRWLVVVTPVGAAGDGIDGAIAPLVLLTVALLLGVGLAMGARYQRIRDAALSDPVTGLPNRRAFSETVEPLTAEVGPAHPLSLLVLDLDSLEDVNAMEGHAAGDRLLRAVTSCLHARLPSHSAAYRLAGSRLAVTVRGGAWAAFEAASDVHHGLRDDIHTSVRIGVCEHEPGWSAEALLSAADAAAAAARRGGRDVLVHTPGMDVSDQHPDAVHQHALAIALARAVDAKDAYTHSHCETVAELSAIIAGKLGLDAARVTRVRLAGLVHDVGKIGVPDAILQKPGPLTEDEFEIIKGHAAAGHKILAGTNLADEAEWVRHHHERMDGKGYPDGLHGDQLALEARILHVADAFEAMTSDRPYRRSMPQQAAIDELLRHAGTQFDPDCVAALIARLGPSSPPAALRHGTPAEVG